jgi:predicted transcriptional regulator of viral defense system
MPQELAVAKLSELCADSLGIFRGRDAVEAGVTRKQLASLHTHGVINRVLPDTYRMTAVPPSSEQDLRAALSWAGDEAAAAGLSAAELYRLEGLTAAMPEIVVPASSRVRSNSVIVHRSHKAAALMAREIRGMRVTGVERTLLQLAATLDEEKFEIACEDARRRHLTSVAALRAYLRRFGRPGRPGVRALPQLLDELDPRHAARSTLEVKTRRLLATQGPTGFVREFPLE